MTDDAPAVLKVPHPLACKLSELREAREVYEVDLISGIGGAATIEKFEALAFIAYRRQGLSRAQAKRAAAEISPAEFDVDVDEAASGEGEAPNPSSSVGS
jgi:hypothetical protein